MILFCEDCGKKNYLDPSMSSKGRVRFRCTSCDYLNTIKLKTILVGFSDKTDVFFTQLKAIPEIIGAFLLHTEKGVIINQMPEFLKTEDLLFLGKKILKNYKLASFLYPDITRVSLAIEQRNLVLVMVKNDLALILSCRQFPLSNSIEKMLTQDNLSMIQPRI